LLFVGADGVRKGLDELCTALDAIATEPLARKLSAVVVSKHKPSCQRFNALRHEFSLPRDAVQALMQQSHLYCMVPSRESFGLVFVEAMAAGCAIIADDDIPRQEILDQGSCGVLLPARRSDLMAKAILSLLADRTRMSGLALSAQRRALARYAPRTVARAYASAFQRMANKEAVPT
jgi:glycosyltransferase involved in cell wall biosynthesis